MEIDNIKVKQYKDTEYYISRCGRSWSTKSNIWIKINDNGIGYKQFAMMINNKRVNILVSRAVYTAWKGDIPKDMQIDHKDNNPANNDLSNLQCISRKDNLKRIDQSKRKNNPSKMIGAIDSTTMKAIEVYNSMNEAQKSGKYTKSNISRVINTDKQYKGYLWRYISVNVIPIPNKIVNDQYPGDWKWKTGEYHIIGRSKTRIPDDYDSDSTKRILAKRNRLFWDTVTIAKDYSYMDLGNDRYYRYKDTWRYYTPRIRLYLNLTDNHEVNKLINMGAIK